MLKFLYFLLSLLALRVEVKVTFTATNYDGETKIEKYTITDTLSSSWADIDTENIEIQVGNKLLTADDFTVTPIETAGVTTGFELEIPWVNSEDNKTFKYASPSEVVITYSATVLEAAASMNPANQNNMNTVTSAWDAEGDSTTTKVYNMGFTKVDGTNNTPLSGAKFGLYSDDTCTTPVNVKTTGTNGIYIVDKDSSSNEVETYAEGQVVIMGLKEGTYYLKETAAPAGYNLVKTATEVVIGDTTDTLEIGNITYTVNNDELNIVNYTGVELPSTGCEGTTMLITIGSMVALAFAVLLITHKKMSVYRD